MEMTDRVRYGHQPRRTVGAAASWLVGVFIAFVLTRGMIIGSMTVVVGVAGLLLLGLWALLWWRYRRRGVFVSRSKVWVSHVFRTRSVSLSNVTVVDAMPSKPDGVRRLVLHLENGRHLAAPLRGYAARPGRPVRAARRAALGPVHPDPERPAAAGGVRGMSEGGLPVGRPPSSGTGAASAFAVATRPAAGSRPAARHP